VLVCNNFDDIDTLVGNPVPEAHENMQVRNRRLSRLLSGQSLDWENLRQSYMYQAAIDRITNI
jgi:beta-N-acetylhexosaminidase